MVNRRKKKLLTNPVKWKRNETKRDETIQLKVTLISIKIVIKMAGIRHMQVQTNRVPRIIFITFLIAPIKQES